jgi:hypothetical protein
VKKDTLVPNNEMISKLIDTNKSLIPDKFIEAFSKWEAHIYAFKKHTEDGQFYYSQFQFPSEVEEIVQKVCFSDSLKQGKSKAVLTWLKKKLSSDKFHAKFLIGSFLFNPTSKRDVDLVIKKIDSLKFWFKLRFRRNLHASIFSYSESKNFEDFVKRNKFKVEISNG